jgi:hypothetical protein
MRNVRSLSENRDTACRSEGSTHLTVAVASPDPHISGILLSFEGFVFSC